MTSQTVCIIQARMGSTRLSGKVLQPILGRPMLWWVMHRVQQARLLGKVVIATTTEPADDAIVALCERHGWSTFRGSEQDVLDRYYQAAQQYGADVVVRITSDCPLIDPWVIDYTISAHLSAAPQVDYTSNSIDRTYPRGLDTEAFSMDALRRCWRDATLPPEREHVTYYMYRHPERFNLLPVTNQVDYARHRWTVDTPEDMELVQRVYQHFGHGDFHWREVLALLEAHPDWIQINQHIEQKKV